MIFSEWSLWLNVWEVACIFSAGEPCSPSSSTILPHIYVPSKFLALVQRAISIRAHQG